MHWELISLKEVSIQKKIGNLEHCNFLTVTVMWIKVYCLEWEWLRESVFDITDTKNADFFPENGKKSHFLFYLFIFFFLSENGKKKK